jgi:hypothetical protein
MRSCLQKTSVIGGCLSPVVDVNNNSISPNTLDKVMCFDPYTKRWNQAASMRTKRTHHACASISGKVYVAGGYSYESQQDLVTAEVYDPISDRYVIVRLAYLCLTIHKEINDCPLYINTKVEKCRRWEDLPPMPCAPKCLLGLSIGGKFHVFGIIIGHGGGNVYLIYDPMDGRWHDESGEDSFHAGLEASNVICVNDYILHIEREDGVVRVLDMQHKQWEEIGMLPRLHHREHRRLCGMAIFDGNLYVVSPLYSQYSTPKSIISVRFSNLCKLTLEWHHGQNFNFKHSYESVVVAAIEE